MKELDSNPFLELEFEELFSVPLVSTQDVKKNNATTVTEPEPVKVPAQVPVSNVSSEDIPSIADISALPSSAAGGEIESLSSQLVLSNFIQIFINTHFSKYGSVESVGGDSSINPNSHSLNNINSLQLNEILSTFGHSEHFDMDAHLEKTDAFSSPMITASNFQALGTAAMFVLTASVYCDELHAPESYL
ncbi:MAG: hypothetical protein AB7D28_11325 [Candidatus Berkiella sp.]